MKYVKWSAAVLGAIVAAWLWYGREPSEQSPPTAAKRVEAAPDATLSNRRARPSVSAVPTMTANDLDLDSDRECEIEFQRQEREGVVKDIRAVIDAGNMTAAEREWFLLHLWDTQQNVFFAKQAGDIEPASGAGSWGLLQRKFGRERMEAMTAASAKAPGRLGYHAAMTRAIRGPAETVSDAEWFQVMGVKHNCEQGRTVKAADGLGFAKQFFAAMKQEHAAALAACDAALKPHALPGMSLVGRLSVEKKHVTFRSVRLTGLVKGAPREELEACYRDVYDEVSVVVDLPNMVAPLRLPIVL